MIVSASATLLNTLWAGKEKFDSMCGRVEPYVNFIFGAFLVTVIAAYALFRISFRSLAFLGLGANGLFNYFHNRTKASWSEQLTDLRKTRTLLKEQIISLEATKALMNEQLVAIEGANVNLNEQIVNLEATKASMNEQLVAIEGANVNLNEQIVNLEATKASMNEQLVAIEGANVNLSEKVNQLESANATLGRLLVCLTQTGNDIGKANDKMVQELQDRLKELATVEQQLKDRNVSLNLSTTELNRITSRLEELQQQIAAATGSLMDLSQTLSPTSAATMRGFSPTIPYTPPSAGTATPSSQKQLFPPHDSPSQKNDPADTIPLRISIRDERIEHV